MIWMRGKYEYHSSARDRTRILGHSAHIIVTKPTEISQKIICFGLVSFVILLALFKWFDNAEHFDKPGSFSLLYFFLFMI
jgi:hypothetical protein